MDKRIRKNELEIARLPHNEQLLGGIQRKYRLNDAIYNYLLEKRAEAKISQASSLPDNIVIEPAKMVGTGPFLPRTSKNYLFALVLGFAIPYVILLLKTILNDKLVPQDNVAHLTYVPVLGEILHNRRRNENIMEEIPTSNIAESYRALRTNIEFNFKGVPHKSILVTSSVAGEGKTFSALNLAMSYAQLNRRTILINADLRKDTRYFSKNGKSSVGLCNYLIRTATMEEIICKSSNTNLDYILSGQLPPYPLETIAQGDFPDLINRLKDIYDCIILDATPLAQIKDAYLYISDVDVVMVVARYNYTLKRVFAMVMDELKQKGIQNTFVVLNDNRSNHDLYGYGYGSGSGSNKKKRFKLLSLFRPKNIGT
jgi:capsular exopolysaccharide synthesis family protein